jgi:hypothetical protein
MGRSSRTLSALVAGPCGVEQLVAVNHTRDEQESSRDELVTLMACGVGHPVTSNLASELGTEVVAALSDFGEAIEKFLGNAVAGKEEREPVDLGGQLLVRRRHGPSVHPRSDRSPFATCRCRA